MFRIEVIVLPAHAADADLAAAATAMANYLVAQDAHLGRDLRETLDRSLETLRLATEELAAGPAILVADVLGGQTNG